MVDGNPCADPKAKATALNNYYESVFTKEDLPTLDTLNAEESIPNLSGITFSVEGIQQLLSELDINKANNPDKILPFGLKECAEEISSVATASHFNKISFFWCITIRLEKS